MQMQPFFGCTLVCYTAKAKNPEIQNTRALSTRAALNVVSLLHVREKHKLCEDV